MVIVYMLKCGMANQLFIYTYARYLCDKYHKKLVIYYPHKQMHNASYENCLANYKLRIDCIINYKQMTILSKCRNLQYLLLLIWNKMLHRPADTHVYIEHRLGEKLSRHGIYLNHDINCLEEYLCSVQQDLIWVNGYFQFPFFAYKMRKNLLNELTPVKALENKYEELINHICSCNSICIHVRCGDYIKSKKHFVCTEEYYVRAINKMNQKEMNVVYFVFSDDMEYVRGQMNLFGIEDKVVYVSDGVLQDYEELYIMKLCKHFIISNSTFSWWAQFLCENKGKSVIAPSKWYAADNMIGALYDKNWEIIECD